MTEWSTIKPKNLDTLKCCYYHKKFEKKKNNVDTQADLHLYCLHRASMGFVMV